MTELGSAEARAGLGHATAHLRRAVDEAARGRAGLELARALKFGLDAVGPVEVLEALEPELDALEPGLRELVEIEHIACAYISEAVRGRLAERTAALRDTGRRPPLRPSCPRGVLPNPARPLAAAEQWPLRAVL